MAKLNKASYPEPRKVRDYAIPEETIAKALIKASGRVTHAADALGMYWSSVHDRIRESPYLQRVKQDCLEKRIDAMEKGLDSLVEEHNLGAICFGLKTLGKSRGYTEHTPILVPTEIAAGLEAMMKQLASHQESKKTQIDLNSEDKTSISS